MVDNGRKLIIDDRWLEHAWFWLRVVNACVDTVLVDDNQW